MKVLISAYSCLPGYGSEPGAGWAWTNAATRDHEVWLLTHSANAAVLEPLRARDPHLARRLHPIYLHIGGRIEQWRRGGPQRFMYYMLWQVRLVSREATRLHSEIGFDVAHHVTYASDWLPAGVSTVRGLPFVWGPVGGASTLGTPELWRHLGIRGFLSELTRAVALVPLRRTVGRANARRASVVLAQNGDVARAFADAPVVVEPHVAVESATVPARTPSVEPPVAMYAGRLLAWKGVRLGLAALRRPEAAGWRLDVYGDGPERARLERLAVRWQLTDRVRFLGHRPRPEVAAALARADVFLLPSLHEAAGWVVAEAATAGCPVVAFDVAGPATMLGPGEGVLVEPSGDVIRGLAVALERARLLRPRSDRWLADRLPDLLASTYERATRRTPMSMPGTAA